MNIQTKLYATKIFYSDLVAICENKITLRLSKSAHTGMVIFDLSKALIYELHYEYIKKINMVTKLDYYLLILIL